MNELRTNTVLKIIALLIIGESRNRIIVKTGASAGSIQNISEQLQREVGKEVFELVRTLMRHAAKNQLPLGELVQAHELRNKIVAMGVNISDVDAFLSNIFLKALEYRLEPGRIGQMLAVLSDILKEERDFDRLPDKVRELVAQHTSLKTEIENLKLQQVREKARADNVIAVSNVTIEELDRFRHIEQVLLKEHNLKIEDLPGLASAVEFALERGFSFDKLLAGQFIDSQLDMKKKELEGILNSIERAKLKL